MNYKWHHILIGLFSFIVVNLFFWPPKPNLINHNIAYDPTQTLAPENMYKVLSKINPEVILIGNSMLEKGVHSGYFERLTRKQTGFIGVGASASAFWYLVFKNVICQLPQKPKYTAFFFRDHFFTEPTYRTANEHKERIDMLSKGKEEVLDKKAYLSEMGDLEYSLRMSIPCLQKQYDISEKTLTAIKDYTSKTFFYYPKGEADKTIERVFADENLDLELLSAYQLEKEKNDDESKYDFATRYPKSFLPDIIQLAKANGIELVFVRIKRRRDVEIGQQGAKLEKYIADLRKQLELEGAMLIDYTNNTQLTETHFADGDHLNQEPGMKLFTEMVADTMNQVVFKK